MAAVALVGLGMVLLGSKISNDVVASIYADLRAAVFAGDEAAIALAFSAHNYGLVAYAGKYVKIFAEILVVMIKRYAGFNMVARKAEGTVAQLYIIINAAYAWGKEGLAVLRNAPAAADIGSYFVDDGDYNYLFFVDFKHWESPFAFAVLTYLYRI